MSGFSRNMAVMAILAALGILASGAWLYRIQEKRIRRDAEKKLSSIANLKVSQIVSWRRDQLAEGAELGQRPATAAAAKSWLNHRDQDAFEALSEEMRYIVQFDEYVDVLLFDAKTGDVFSINGHKDAFHDEAREMVERAAAQKEPVLTELHMGAGLPTPHISVIAPIFDEEDTLSGAFVLINDATQFLYPLLQSWPGQSDSAETLIVRRDGSDVLFLNELRHQPGSAMNLRVPLTQTDLPAAMALQGVTGVVKGLDYRGREVVAVIDPIPGSTWFMISKEDAQEVYAAWRFQSVLLISMMIGALFLMLAVLAAFWHREEKNLYRSLFQAENARGLSERRYNATLRSIGDGVIVVDAQGRLEMLNPVAENLCGWSGDEAVGRPVEEVFRIVNEETRQPLKTPVGRVLNEGRIVGLANHTLLIARDGTERPIADSAAPIRDDSGVITGVVLVFRDQTAEHAAKRALQKSEARFRAIYEQAAVGVAQVGLDGRWLGVNRRMCEISGRSEETLLGLMFQDITHPDDIREDEDYVRRLLAGEIADYSMEKRYVRPDGSSIWVNLTVALARNAGGEPDYFISVVEDLSRRKQAEERYETLFNEMLDGFALQELICNEAGEPVDSRFLAVNPAFERLTDLKAPDIVGRTVCEVLPDFDPKWIDIYGRVALNRAALTFEEYSERFGRFFEITVFSPAPMQAACILSDISARKRAENDLLESERRLRTLMDNLPGLAYRCKNDHEWSMVFISEGSLVLTGYTPDDLMPGGDVQYAHLILPEDRDRVWADVQRGVDCTGSFEIEYRIVTRDNDIKWVWERGRAVSGLDDEACMLEGLIIDITDRRQVEEALREIEERFARALDNIPAVVVIYDADLRIRYINRATTQLTGQPVEFFLGKRDSDLWPSKEYSKYAHALEGALRDRKIHSADVELDLPESGTKHLSITCVPIVDKDGLVREILGIMHDLTERKVAEQRKEELEERLRQSQKMEAIGQLAGGIAHDFNNILQAVMGNGQFLLDSLVEGSETHGLTLEILKGAERAAMLTRQLLAFSRRQVLEQKNLDLGELILNLLKMIGRILGEDIDLKFIPSIDRLMVRADPGQLEQVMLNLCVNARDAMPDGGELLIEINPATLDEAFCNLNSWARPGHYAMISVADTGCGMNKATLSQIFEPFFTTKEVGKGTGLGLASVHGVISQHGGLIYVYSEPEGGTVFKIFIPLIDQTASESEPAEFETPPGGDETILIAEDDVSVRCMTSRILTQAGYRVFQAGDGAQAADMVRERHKQIDLVLSDVVMPQGGGKEILSLFRELNPNGRLLFMSGYSSGVVEENYLQAERASFIQKPFDPDALLFKIRELLDRPV